MTTTTSGHLETDATHALLQLRVAIASIFDTYAGPDARARDIEAALGLDKKLAWRLHKFVREPEVLAASKHLPSQIGVEIVLGVAEKKSAPKAMLDGVRQAYESYQHVIKSHAGERVSMEMMLASASPASRMSAMQEHQKAAYKSNSFIWGVQARVQFSSFILHPSEDDPDHGDIAVVRGLIDFRRIRPHVSWVVGRIRCIDDDGEIRAPLVLDPIDPQPERGDGLPPAPLLSQFCSSPAPLVRRAPGHDRHIEDELVETQIGNHGVLDYVTGEAARGIAARYRDEHNDVANLSARIRTPVRWFISDVIAHPNYAPSNIQCAMFSDVAGVPDSSFRSERDRLVSAIKIDRLGRERNALYTPQIPQYPAMIGHVLDRLGWAESEFDVFRVAVEHPVMPSSIDFQWPLPERAPQHADNSARP
jgi:hypothetical protein